MNMAGSGASIEVDGLVREFRKGPRAVDGIDLAVSPGEIYGFLGPNGAGKSTAMRVILGLDSVDQGSALIGGRPYAGLPHPLRVVGSPAGCRGPAAEPERA